MLRGATAVLGAGLVRRQLSRELTVGVIQLGVWVERFEQAVAP